MRSLTWVWLAALVLPAAAWSALSAEGARVVQAVHARLQNVPRLPPGAAQGAAARAHLVEVQRTVSECEVQIRQLIRDRNEPEVQAARAKVEELRQYAASIQQGLQGAGQSSPQLSQKTYQFVQELVTPGYPRLQALVQLAQNPDGPAHLGPQPAASAFALQHLAAVDAGCRGKYAEVAAQPHPNPGMADQSPSLWCKMGAERVALVQLSARKTVQGELGGAGRTIEQMRENLEQREGYLETDVLMIRRALWSPDELAAELAQRHASLLTVAQMSGGGAAMAESIRALSKDLMQEAGRLAPRWKFPPPDRAMRSPKVWHGSRWAKTIRAPRCVPPSCRMPGSQSARTRSVCRLIATKTALCCIKLRRRRCAASRPLPTPRFSTAQAIRSRRA